MGLYDKAPGGADHSGAHKGIAQPDQNIPQPLRETQRYEAAKAALPVMSPRAYEEEIKRITYWLDY